MRLNMSRSACLLHHHRVLAAFLTRPLRLKLCKEKILHYFKTQFPMSAHFVFAQYL